MIEAKMKMYLFTLVIAASTAFAESSLESLTEKLTHAQATPDEIKQAFKALSQMKEDQVTNLLMEKLPSADIAKTENLGRSFILFQAVQQQGGPILTGYLIRVLKDLENVNTPLKPTILYCLMKAGSKNLPRVQEFLTSYRKSQTDPDVTHAIDVLQENLPALLIGQEAEDVTKINVEERVQDLSQRLHTVWYQCPQKLWPVSQLRPQALFTNNGSTDQGWLVNENGLAKVDQVPPYLAGDFKFLFSTFKGRPTIAINLPRTFKSDPYYKGSYALYVALHEGFHMFFQRGDWRPDGNPQRGDKFPENPTPRYYRRMIYENLKTALESHEPEVSLRQAAYWYKKWSTEFADEVSQATDRNEGTAQYFDVLGVGFSSQGCSVDKNKILDFVKRNYDMMFQVPTGFEDEGYQIGSLASIQLWKKESPGWQKKISEGASPLSLLLSRITGLPQSDDFSLLEESKTKAAKSNSEAQNLLHGDLENYDSKDYVRVVISRKYRIPTYPTAKIVIPEKLPGATIYIVNKNFEAQSGDNSIKASGMLPLFEGLQTPCESNGDVFLISENAVDLNAPIKVGKSDVVEFRVDGKFRVKDGMKWLCTN